MLWGRRTGKPLYNIIMHNIPCLWLHTTDGKIHCKLGCLRHFQQNINYIKVTVHLYSINSGWPTCTRLGNVPVWYCFLLFYWDFTPFSTLFQLYHCNSSLYYSWSLGYRTSTRLENVSCPRTLHHDRDVKPLWARALCSLPSQRVIKPWMPPLHSYQHHSDLAELQHNSIMQGDHKGPLWAFFCDQVS